MSEAPRAQARLELAARALTKLQTAVGPEAGILGSQTEDFRLGAVPDLVALPTTGPQAAELMILARAESWRVTVAGAGTWTAVAPDHRVSLVVGAARLTQVHDYEPADPSASVGAGVRLTTLATLAAGHRQCLPLDPPSAPAATIGAAMALGAGGPLRKGHGTARDHVLGLELVTGDGRILSLGGRVLKNVAGYDLTRLVVGSRGALELVTRLNLRLRPLPELDCTLALAGAELGECLKLAQLAGSRPEAVAVELLSPALSSRICAEPLGWVVLVRLQAWSEAAAAARQQIEASARTSGARVLELPTSSWDLLNQAELTPLTVRLGGRPSALAQTVALAAALPGVGPDPLLAGHCADGIVRLFLSPSQSEQPQWPAAIVAARQQMESTGGTLFLGPARSPLLRGVPAFGALGPGRKLMSGLRAAFDPGAVLCDGGLDF